MKKPETTVVSVQKIDMVETSFRIIGTTPLIQNRLANKAMQTLLIGGKRKTTADKAKIKHHPFQEFIDAAHIVNEGPTMVGIPVVAIKSAMVESAGEVEGLTKVSTRRLLWFPENFVNIYGVPKLHMTAVKTAGMNRTPDIRTRPIYPKWGGEFKMRFVKPQMTLEAVANLLHNAGVLNGVGDWRQQKGSGNYGSFRILTEGEKDDEWDDLLLNHGKEAQRAAFENPDLADSLTEELYEFYNEELTKRAA